MPSVTAKCFQYVPLKVIWDRSDLNFRGFFSWMLLKRGTGSRERGTEVWERVVSGNLHKNPKWRSKKRERERRRQRKEFVLLRYINRNWLRTIYAHVVLLYNTFSLSVARNVLGFSARILWRCFQVGEFLNSMFLRGWTNASFLQFVLVYLTVFSLARIPI